MTETLEETFTEMVEGPVLTTSTEAVPKRKKRQKLGPEHAEMIVEGVKKRVAEILAESEARMALVEAAPGADARTGGRSEAGDVFTRGVRARDRNGGRYGPRFGDLPQTNNRFKHHETKRTYKYWGRRPEGGC